MPLPGIQLFERFNNLGCSHANGWESCYGVNWMSHVFTVGTTGQNLDHITTGVKLYMTRGTDPDPGNLTASITTTTADAFGKIIPTTNVIATGTILKQKIPYTLDTPGAGWVEIDFSTTGTLRKNTSYGIVVKSTYDAVLGNTNQWAYNYSCTDDLYWTDTNSGGERWSNDSGATWDAATGPSCLYEEYGTTLFSKSWLSLPLIFNLKSKK